MYLFISRICEYLNINSFKDEESEKMSADSAHIQGASGGESTNSPAVSSSYSLTIDTEYVFCFSNIITILRHYLIDDYYRIISIMRIPPN